MADFSVDVSSYCDRAAARALLVLRVIAFDMLARVQQLTPVDTGFLRSQWTAMLPGDAEPVAGRVPPPATAIFHASLGTKIILLNPTAYARRLEYGFVGEDKAGRYFNQPGRHFVSQTIAEAPAIADAAVRRVMADGGTP